MKNTLLDLNNHLFAQLERLGDESLEGAELESEIKRGKAITGVAKAAVDNARLVLEAQQFKAEHAGQNAEKDMPEMLESKRQKAALIETRAK
ncbi:hypothetical protein [Pseudoalteromonas ruthenica]|uniref:hypothetical protein n=1 Tax=Pseudoalteromonas ruthenica TaxID=151081 RepID=UPI00110B0A14|nr:hypothetical protein [Pseudoalteromonas ruthenica]TMP23795.1 hypothetical protein CWC06_09590 [Pseudoalteromonas ruthenica]